MPGQYVRERVIWDRRFDSHSLRGYMSVFLCIVLYNVDRGLGMGFLPYKGCYQITEELIISELILNW
jgi:hypothetical protein